VSASALMPERQAAYREDPLEGQGHSPRPFVLTPVICIRHTGDQDASDRPTHLEGSRASTTKRERNDLTCVGRCIGNEQAPRDAFKGLSDD
jgi:hypothetical protein